MSKIIEKKWDEVYSNRTDLPLSAAKVLAEHSFLLPESGVALDLACGLGANALLLAEQGLDVHAFDISSVALEKLQQLAQQQGLKVTTRQVDIQANVLAENSFDVIVITRFLDRSLSGAIVAALKPKGLLFYQTYTKQKITDSPPNNPDFLLAENELLKLFSPLKVIFYQEHGRVGDITCGERNEALFVGQKSSLKT
jgi:2-polyprenyl-3-methyl-5-hydroxy-6-metoxy-1,4-benzoquinol methylase